MDRRDSALELSSEEMRQLGYRVVDMIVAHAESLASMPVARAVDRATLRTELRTAITTTDPADAAAGDARTEESSSDRADDATPTPELEVIPRRPVAIDDVLARVSTTVLGAIAHVDHPRFFAYVPSPGNFVGAMADALASGFNVFAGAWPVASGPAQVELELIAWLARLCGLPEGAGGLFLSGGSIANLTALIVARDRSSDHAWERAVVYCSDQTHSSIARALDVLGLPAERRRVIVPRSPRMHDDAGDSSSRSGGFALGAAEPVLAAADPALGAVDAAPGAAGLALGAADLASAIAADRAAGLHPWCVVANGGATSTGAVDDLEAIGALCRQEKLWMHVDAAYGGGVLACDRGRSLLRGIELADSVTLDPHKWLFQPFDIGCLLVRDEAVLERSFRSIPAYLRDSAVVDDQVNFRDRGIELTRPFRALKLWMSLQVFGTDALAAAVEHGLRLAELAGERLAASDLWRVETPATLGIVTFRFALFVDAVDDGRSDDAHRELAHLLVEDGFAMLSTTDVAGRVCLRLCTINPRTSDDDVAATIARLEELAPLVRQSR